MVIFGHTEIVGLDKTLDAGQCYRALQSRDRRFDGRFYIGVRTTGIYCRPICPAPTPKEENVTFFSHPASAETAGFRACRRCHPERSAGPPAWAERSATVSRALRLIDDGFLDGASVDDLSDHLGVGTRRLRRLFADEVGASPAAIARSRRAHLARRLLDETDLRIVDIAFTAGYQSLRQFNHAMKSTFGRTPSELRGKRDNTAGEVTVRLQYRPPLDWPALSSWLSARAIRGVEIVDSAYRRTVAVDGRVGTVTVEPATNELALRVSAELVTALPRIVPRIRRLFDLAADPMTIGDHLATDPDLAPLVQKRPGVRVPGTWDPWEIAVRAVVGQQVSVAAATTVTGRIAEQFGKPYEGSEDIGLTHLFPEREVLADAELEAVGMVGARANAIRTLAVSDIALDGSLALDELEATLIELPGIGPWTANYVAMRCGEPDAFPASDLGLRKATGVSAAELAKRAERWRPWRAYAAMYLWMEL